MNGTDRLTGKLGTEPILPVRQSVSIDTMINFDGDGDRDGTCKGLLTPNDSVSFTVMLTDGTFDLFDGHCDGQNGLHTHICPVDVTFVTQSFDVNIP